MSTTEAPLKEGHGGSTMITAALAVFLILYFLFPGVLLYPMLVVFGKGGPPPAVSKVITVAFWPVTRLTMTFPAYNDFLQKEAALLGYN